MNADTISKKDLVELGYTSTDAATLFKRARFYMVELGYKEYNNKKITRVPAYAVEKLLGLNNHPSSAQEEE